MVQPVPCVPVLVTGGAGYIGSHVVLALVDAGYGVVVLDDLSTGRHDAVPPGASLIVGNVGDRGLVKDLLEKHKIASVMHFAGSVLVGQSVLDPLGYYENNTVNSLALIDTCVKAGVANFIFSSTAAVYGIPVEQPIAESAPTVPINPYGASKLMSEIMLRDAAAVSRLRYVILRYFNVAGADPKGRLGQSAKNATHLIKVGAQTALGRRQSMSIFGEDYPTRDGTCERDFIHVSDLIDAHLDALAYLRRGGASLVCNCGYGHGATVKEVIDVVKQVSGVDFHVEISPRRAGDPAVIVARAERARETLGWKPKRDNLEEIVRQAIDWERRLHNRGL